jgi:hypothetical protein
MAADPYAALGQVEEPEADPYKSLGSEEKPKADSYESLGKPVPRKTIAEESVNDERFDPVRYVAENPNDPEAVETALDVQELREQRSALEKTGAFLKQAPAFVKAPVDYVRGAGETIFDAGKIAKTFAKDLAGQASGKERMEALGLGEEFASSVRVGTKGTIDLGRKILRGAGDVISNRNPDREERKKRLITDASVYKEIEDIRRGQKTLSGVDVRTLPSYDEERVARKSMSGDLTQIVPMVAGGKAAILAGKAVPKISRAAAIVSEVAKPIAAPIRRAAGVPLVAAGKVASGVQRVYDAPIVGTVARGATGYAIGDALGMDPSSAAIGAMIGFGGGRGAAMTRRLERGAGTIGGKLQRQGRVLMGIEPPPLVIRAVNGKPSLVTRFGRAIQPELAGTAGGLAFSAPFLFAADSPEEAGQIAFGGAGMGAIGGFQERPTLAMDAYFNAGKNPKLKGTLSDEPFSYGRDKQLDAMHDQAIGSLTPEKRSEINRARDLLRGKSEVYVLSKEEFIKRFGGDQAGVVSKDGNIYMNSDSAQLGHEVGHVIINDIRQNDPAAYARLLRVAETVNLGEFKKRYEAELQKGGTKKELAIEDMIEEFLAEQAQLSANGKSLAQLGGKDSLGRIFTGAMGRFLERVSWGLPVGVQTTSPGNVSNLGVAPSFVAEKVLRGWMDKRAKEIPGKRPPPLPGDVAKPLAAIDPTKPAPVDPYQFAAVFRSNLYDIEEAQRKEDSQLLGRRLAQPSSTTDLIRVAGATNDLGEALISGKVKTPEEALDFLEASLRDSPSWQELSPEQKNAIVDFTIDNPEQVFDYFATNPKTKPTPESTPEEMIKALGGQPVPRAEPLRTVQAPEPAKPQPLGNIRVDVGTTAKASVDPFMRTGRVSPVAPLGATGGEPVVGLRPAMRRRVNAERQVVNEPGTGLVGRAIDQNNPKEVALQDAAAKDSPNPEKFVENLRGVEQAIASGQEISTRYESSANEISGSPTNKERGLAQDQSNYGLVSREGVQKTITPKSFTVLESAEPVFTPESVNAAKVRLEEFWNKAQKKGGGIKANSRAKLFGSLEEAQQAAEAIAAARAKGEPVEYYSLDQTKLIHDMYDKKPTTRVLVNGYSQDKVIANAKNLADAIEDSNLTGDPQLGQAFSYLRSGEWARDLVDRNENMAKGYRGDGGIFTNAEGVDINAAFREGRPVKIPDWKIQILNSLEGGPANNYFPEAVANQTQAGRTLPVDPVRDTLNPFYARLEQAGDALKLARGADQSVGVGEIIAPASETLRLDRVQGIEGRSPVELPPSSYAQQAAGFSPKVGDLVKFKNSDDFGTLRFLRGNLAIVDPFDRYRDVHLDDRGYIRKLGAKVVRPTDLIQMPKDGVFSPKISFNPKETEAISGREAERVPLSSGAGKLGSFEEISSNLRGNKEPVDPNAEAYKERVARILQEEIEFREMMQQAGLENKTQRPPDDQMFAEGAEHAVYIDPEDPNRVIKRTHPGEFGAVHSYINAKGEPALSVAGPSDYLERLHYDNVYLGDDKRMIGIEVGPNGRYSIVTSQPVVRSQKRIIAGKEIPFAPKQEDINTMLEKEAGLKKLDMYTWYDSENGLLIDDTHNGNFIQRPDGKIQAVDISVRKLSDKEKGYLDRRLGTQKKFSPKSEYVETPEFKKWFGKSRVVDPDGNPMVVYRGTNAPEGAGINEDSYFSNSDKNASSYATGSPQGGELPGNPRVGAFYLSLENPKVIDAKGADFTEVPFEGRKRTTAAIVNVLKKDGEHDGVIFKNIRDTYDAEVGTDTVYAVFDKEKIRNAIDPLVEDHKFSPHRDKDLGSGGIFVKGKYHTLKAETPSHIELLAKLSGAKEGEADDAYSWGNKNGAVRVVFERGSRGQGFIFAEPPPGKKTLPKEARDYLEKIAIKKGYELALEDIYGNRIGLYGPPEEDSRFSPQAPEAYKRIDIPNAMAFMADVAGGRYSPEDFPDYQEWLRLIDADPKTPEEKAELKELYESAAEML